MQEREHKYVADREDFIYRMSSSGGAWAEEISP